MNPELFFCAGLLLAGLASAIAIPFVALRLSAACIVFLGILLLRWKVDRWVGRLILFSYVWFWMICVSVTGGGIASSTLIALALLLCFPAVALRDNRRGPCLPEADMGVLIGVLLLVAMAAGLCRLPGIGPEQGAREMLGAVLGCLIAWLAVRVAVPSMPPDRLRRAALVSLALCCISLALVMGNWMLSIARAKYLEANGRIESALVWAVREEALAQRLDVRVAVAHALHRQSELHRAAGRIGRWRSTLERAVAADPADAESRRILFQDALVRAEAGVSSARVALFRHFDALPDSEIASDAAERVLPFAAEAGGWQILVRAWRLCRGSPLDALGAPERLPRIGKALYFEREYAPAIAMLEACADRGSADREAVEILYICYLKDGDSVRAKSLLSRFADFFSPEESIFLASLSQRSGLDEDGVDFENTVRLLDCRALDTSVEAGGTIRIVFRWRVLAPVDPGWKVFVHLRQGKYEGFFFQGDHPFGLGRGQPGGWELGAELSYELGIMVPGDTTYGDYRISVGIWDGSENRRPEPYGAALKNLKISSGNRVILRQTVRIGD